MAIKRCSHCKDAGGQGIELYAGEKYLCNTCGCMWDLDGKLLIAGNVNGKPCPSADQQWTDKSGQ